MIGPWLLTSIWLSLAWDQCVNAVHVFTISRLMCIMYSTLLHFALFVYISNEYYYGTYIVMTPHHTIRFYFPVLYCGREAESQAHSGTRTEQRCFSGCRKA